MPWSSGLSPVTFSRKPRPTVWSVWVPETSVDQVPDPSFWSKPRLSCWRLTSILSWSGFWLLSIGTSGVSTPLTSGVGLNGFWSVIASSKSTWKVPPPPVARLPR